MSSSIASYLSQIQSALETGHAQEHSYRPALETLFKDTTNLKIVNEPKGSAHGRPDFIFLKDETPIAWVEAKDIYVDLDKIEKGEQMARYYGYANLILTNGIEFRFYKNGQRYGDPIIIGVKNESKIDQKPDVFGTLERTIADFVTEPVDSIRSAQHLAKIMGGKARRLRDNISEILAPGFGGMKGDIEKIRDILKTKLIHDLDDENFADLYSQTLVYGLFVARYNDETPDSFSRTEAREKIPASNHLLQQFFDHIAGANFEKKLSFIVDELCDVFVHADVKALVHGLYEKGDDATHDPIIHFYEDFLREYDPKLRVERGVFYTPLPVVRYIVRSVDALLKEHFDLPQGLADRAQIDWKYTEQNKTSTKKIDRVQILDPAVGTGTFLNEVIRNVHERYKDRAGEWEAFANEHLVPRLHGFELMMASYTIAHLKLSMTLAETGVKKLTKRLKIFLTNSLEEAPPKDDTLFRGLGLDGALTEEAQAAEEVKRDLPIMVVLGNPPYSVSSQNASIEIGPDGKKRKTWIGKLIDDYKKDLNEKKLNLDDDYIKFIRFAHHLIEKNGQGIVAMITNNSFLDGITHRQMRKSLLETFDHIYVVDLHGNSKRKEKAPDGGKDENVFDIMQGVSIVLFVKTSEKKMGLGTVHHVDLYGKRDSKYDWLNAHDEKNTKWEKLEAPAPNYFFVPKDFNLQLEYENSVQLNELFPIWNSGIQTKRDSFCIQFSDKELELLKQDVNHLKDDEIRIKYDLPSDGRDWTLVNAIQDLVNKNPIKTPILYRPFDYRKTYYTGNSKGFMAYPRDSVMKNFLLGDNFGIILTRQLSLQTFQHVFAAKNLIDGNTISMQTREYNYIFPLYLEEKDFLLVGDKSQNGKVPNLNKKLVCEIEKILKLTYKWCYENDPTPGFLPEDIFDYIYAILHSPTYRERYKEFLKINFPRVPFTSNKDLFWRLVLLGREIRLLHLMESSKLYNFITQYPVAGDNVVEKVSYDSASQRVSINPTQYFGGVPEAAWNFPIGGYQPLQKWLKDRKGRTLSSDDLEHYQKIVVALVETKRLMEEIDEVIKENGGWPIK